MVETDLDRHKDVVQALVQFKWCSECSSSEPGAVKVVCQSGCGRALMEKCVPLMKTFSKVQSDIDEINAMLNKEEAIRFQKSIKTKNKN